MSETEMSKLLEEGIRASNRTTHAIRALVRFIFIQLTFYTAAFLVWQIGLIFTDSDNCSLAGCTPHEFVYVITGGLIIIGIVLSSRVGWYELELSEVPLSQRPSVSTSSPFATELTGTFASPATSPEQEPQEPNWSSQEVEEAEEVDARPQRQITAAIALTVIMVFVAVFIVAVLVTGALN